MKNSKKSGGKSTHEEKTPQRDFFNDKESVFNREKEFSPTPVKNEEYPDGGKRRPAGEASADAQPSEGLPNPKI